MPDPERSYTVSALPRLLTERSGRSERRLNANSSAEGAGGGFSRKLTLHWTTHP